MLSARSLTKAFGDLVAVDDVSFHIGAGEAFGLLGPNGAGKTTLIHMLVGALSPAKGSIDITGAGAPTTTEARCMIGVAPQMLAIYDELTGEENLQFFGRLYGLGGSRLRERVDWALEFAGLTERRKSRVGTYSGGMKRRLNLVAGLLHEPRLVLMDEPTVGVDPQSRNHLFECVEGLQREGTTILYTTHYMEEAQRLCDRVAIIDRGRLLAMDTVEGLIAQHAGPSLVEARLREAPADAGALPGALEGLTLRVETGEPMEAIRRIDGAGAAIESLHVTRPNLESVFLALTGRTLRDD